jgi:hypothetical protein
MLFTVSACTQEGGGHALGPTGSTPVLGNPAGGGTALGGVHADAGAGAHAAADPNAIARSTRSSLQWKRYATFESDLSQALALTKAELCNEFGTDPCIRTVHLTPLGGHNPFTTGILESSAEPLVGTPTVVERVVLSACLARIEKDRLLGSASAVVFKDLPLDSPAPAPSSAVASALVRSLYQRFLARDAEPFEIDAVASLSVDAQGTPVRGDVFASTACLLVGSQTEFLFY